MGKNIICTNKTSLISKNNLWQVWCIWACSSTEETVRTVWKKLISFIQELDVEIDWNWLRRSEEEDFNTVSMYFRNIVITPPPLPRKKGFGPSVEQDFVTFTQAFVWNWFSGYYIFLNVFNVFFAVSYRRYMAEILPIRCKQYPNKQSINHCFANGENLGLQLSRILHLNKLKFLQSNQKFLLCLGLKLALWFWRRSISNLQFFATISQRAWYFVELESLLIKDDCTKFG